MEWVCYRVSLDWVWLKKVLKDIQVEKRGSIFVEINVFKRYVLYFHCCRLKIDDDLILNFVFSFR